MIIEKQTVVMLEECCWFEYKNKIPRQILIKGTRYNDKLNPCILENGKLYLQK